MKKINIIGSGFSSLSAACYLAKEGFDVNVYEKNAQLGGRARLFEIDGFKFDMGPSWYWMPDIFERFFKDFDKHPSDYYDLVRLDPGYKVFFENGNPIEIPASKEDLLALFEKEEKGGAKLLNSFLKEAAYNYKVAIEDIVYRPGLSPLELVTPQTVSKINRFIKSIRSDVRKRFSNERLIKILEFPVLFLGAKPQNTPSFYNFMNHADLKLGTWYPMGGMYKIVEAMHRLGKELGVHFHTGAVVDEIITEGGRAKGLMINGEIFPSDIILSGADYNHTESLIEPSLRGYSEKFWNKKTFAPSALLYYVGFDKKLENVRHHNLFFDKDFDIHASEIYDNPVWPSNPLFYASFPSLTDISVAPEGKECAFFLIPLAPDLADSEEKREAYFDRILDRLEKHTNQSLKQYIIFKKSYCVKDFKKDYNSFKGNAYGMANTLSQTAFLRPRIKSKKVSNMYFTGQLTVPGPGVPPALISGKIAADLITKATNKTHKHESTV